MQPASASVPATDERWSFAHAADLQPGSPKSFRYRPAWRENWETAKKQLLSLGPEFLIVGGDLTADGWLHPWELREIRAELDALPFPVHSVPGNMDTGNKHTDRRGAWWPKRDDPELNVTSLSLQRFAAIVGPLQWTFVHRGVRFSGAYLAVAGTGLPEEAAFWDWLEELGRLPRARHHVFFSHYALFLDHPGEPNWDITRGDQYLQWYFGIDQPHRGRILEAFQAAGVDLAISGHIHCRRTDVFRGITFYKAPAVCFPQMARYWPDGDAALGFTRIEVTPGGLRPTFIPLQYEAPPRPGYGPGGHPGPECRDYSLAWEPMAPEDRQY